MITWAVAFAHSRGGDGIQHPLIWLSAIFVDATLALALIDWFTLAR